MCFLLGSILHTAAQLEKHPVTPPQHPKLNKENGSVQSEASLPWKELSVENVPGKKPEQSQSLPLHFPVQIVTGDKISENIYLFIYFLKETHQLFWPYTRIRVVPVKIIWSLQ